MMPELIFLKLGGSLITDKTGVEAIRADVLTRLAREIAAARRAQPQLRLVLGHGSGSFGHVAAAAHGTRQGVAGDEGWRGFTEVAAAAARLNRLVVEALLAADVPALSLPPSASTVCRDGEIQSLCAETIAMALSAGIVPVVFGDVAFDSGQGGTIVSTEEVLSFLAEPLLPGWLLLAGETAGVLDEKGSVIPLITRANYPVVASALGGSRGTDVTGGMASKVESMLDLAERHSGMTIRIFSGLTDGTLGEALLNPAVGPGTVIRAES